jgi:hypothetical protein
MPREISGLGNRTKPGYSVTHGIPEYSFIERARIADTFEKINKIIICGVKYH